MERILRYTILKQISGLKVCEWRKAIIVAAWKDLEVLTELEGKKRGRPAMLPENLTSLIMKYIHA